MGDIFMAVFCRSIWYTVTELRHRDASKREGSSSRKPSGFSCATGGTGRECTRRCGRDYPSRSEPRHTCHSHRSTPGTIYLM